ncbi:MAG: 5'/3'-nucleotidase SurE [Simkaniaceae bacterium]
MNKLNILITNDDGIHAPGLFYLAEALKGFAEVTIVAPSEEKSGSSLGISFIHPLEVEPVSFPGGHPAWQVSGTPADCVKIALMLLMKKAPDFVISGINRGSNAGRAVLYSGTLGGAIEGAYKGIPGMGFSCAEEKDPQYEKYTSFIPSIIEHFIQDPLPTGTVLNINFPHENPLGIKMARQGIGAWLDDFEEIQHHGGQKKYMLKGDWEKDGWHEESDYFLLQKGYITAVPIHVHELTCQKTLENRKDSFEKAFLKHFDRTLP